MLAARVADSVNFHLDGVPSTCWPGEFAVLTDVPTAFFSYCRTDSEFALRLAEDLKAAGAKVWMDQLDIEPGVPWDRAVEDALNDCPRLLVILSHVSVKSDNVRDEVSFALSKQKRVIPVLYNECEIPFRLARLQHVDFRSDYSRGLKALLKAVGVAEQPQAITPKLPAPSALAVVRCERPAKQVMRKDQRKHSAERIGMEPQLQRTPKQESSERFSPLRTMAGHTGAVSGVAMTPDGRRVVSASRDKTLMIWDVETGRELCKLVGHSDAVLGVTVSLDGRRVISASADNTLKIWDMGTGRELHTLVGHSAYVHGVAASPGRRLVSASADKTLKIWDMETGRELRTLTGHLDRVEAVAVTHDGRLAVSGSFDCSLKVWDLKTGGDLRTFEGHTSFVDSVALSLDGRKAVSASWDKTLKVWEVDTGRELCTLEGHSDRAAGVALNPDGRLAVSACYLDKTLKLWDLDTGKALAMFSRHRYSCCAWVNPRVIVAGFSESGRIHLLEVKI